MGQAVRGGQVMGKTYKALDGDADVKGKLFRALEYTGKGAVRGVGGYTGGFGIQLISKGQVLLYAYTPEVKALNEVDGSTYSKMGQESLDVTSWEELDDLVKHGYLEEVQHG